MKTLLLAACAAMLCVVLPAAAQQQGVTSDTITIGAHGPITGPAAYIGLAGRDGMLLAIKEINAAGGVNGRKIAAVFEDDGHSPTKALAAVKKLVEQDKVFAVMSVGGSNATVGAVDYMKEKGVPYYVSIASAPPVTWPHATQSVPRRDDRDGTLRRALRRVPRDALQGEAHRDHERARGIPAQRRRRDHGQAEELVPDGAGGPRRIQYRRQGFHAAARRSAEGESGRDRVLRQSRGSRDRDAPGEGARPQAAVLRRQQHGRSGTDHGREGQSAEGVDGLFVDSLPAGFEGARDGRNGKRPGRRSIRMRLPAVRTISTFSPTATCTCSPKG